MTRKKSVRKGAKRMTESLSRSDEQNKTVWRGASDSRVAIIVYLWWATVFMIALIFIVILPDLDPLPSILFSGTFILLFLFVLEKSRRQTMQYEVTMLGLRFLTPTGRSVLVPYEDIQKVVMAKTPADWMYDTRSFDLVIPLLVQTSRVHNRGPGHWKLRNIREYELLRNTLGEYVKVEEKLTRR